VRASQRRTHSLSPAAAAGHLTVNHFVVACRIIKGQSIGHELGFMLAVATVVGALVDARRKQATHAPTSDPASPTAAAELCCGAAGTAACDCERPAAAVAPAAIVATARTADSCGVSCGCTRGSRSTAVTTGCCSDVGGGGGGGGGGCCSAGGNARGGGCDDCDGCVDSGSGGSAARTAASGLASAAATHLVARLSSAPLAAVRGASAAAPLAGVGAAALARLATIAEDIIAAVGAFPMTVGARWWRRLTVLRSSASCQVHDADAARRVAHLLLLVQNEMKGPLPAQYATPVSPTSDDEGDDDGGGEAGASSTAAAVGGAATGGAGAASSSSSSSSGAGGAAASGVDMVARLESMRAKTRLLLALARVPGLSAAEARMGSRKLLPAASSADGGHGDAGAAAAAASAASGATAATASPRSPPPSLSF